MREPADLPARREATLLFADQPRPDLVVDTDLLPLAAIFRTHPRVAPGCHRSQLPLQLAAALQARGIQLASFDRRFARTARLAPMLASVDTALTRALPPVFEP